MIDHYLSIWEIAHRWHDINPDKTDPCDLPLNVQDSIRFICRGVLDDGITLCHVIASELPEDSRRSGFRSEIRNYYVNEFPVELANCLSRKYDKSALDTYYIGCDGLLQYCMEQQCDYPSFWWPLIQENSRTANEDPNDLAPAQIQLQSQSLRPSQIDKLVCQAVAKTLWDVYPTMTITAMSEHTAILEYGGGKLYTGKNTLRNWLSEVAPDSVRKPGRPKSKKLNTNAV
ncbi:MAG: hypothetical protein DID92_2727743824 [Candidatus Nitrotoga sp. SPKER]|nr:MAG: hypothetical protein DID92_2727743824 [Candidatus Nitrotoga sp. SPKER]